MSTVHFKLCLLLFAALMALTTAAAADELTIEVEGVRNEMLDNVTARVAPFRLSGNTRLSRNRREEIRQASERRAASALKPFGYYHAIVNSTITDQGGRSFLLRIQIDPGPPVLVDSLLLDVTGPGSELPRFADWRNTWPLTAGSRLDQTVWEERKQHALDIAEDNGYLGAEFTEHRLEVDLDRNRAALSLVLETGEQAVMGSVTFNQDLVKPRVMDNIPRFSPGDPYHSWLMEKFRADVWRTGYFENIQVIENRRMDESPPVVDLDVRLEERKRNTYQGTLGFGSDTGPRALFSWNRHLISSNGDSFSLGTGFQEHNSEFFVRGSYRIPRNVRSKQFWISDVLAKNETQEVEVTDPDFPDEQFKLADATISDYSIRFGRLKVRDRDRGFRQVLETIFADFLYEDIKYKPNFTSEEDFIRSLTDDEEQRELLRQTSSLAFGIDYDIPFIRGEGFETIGYRHRGWAFTSNEAWGSDEDFTQLYVSTRWNFIKGNRWKFLLRGEVGYTRAKVDDYLVEIDGRQIDLSLTRLPNIYRFKAGGSTSVRGYSFESLSNNGVGSNNIITASAEVEYRFLQKWSGAVFADIGNAFNDWSNIDLKRSYGVGVRWYTIAGAIRLDVARGIDSPDKPWKLNFSIGISLL